MDQTGKREYDPQTPACGVGGMLFGGDEEKSWRVATVLRRAVGFSEIPFFFSFSFFFFFFCYLSGMVVLDSS